MYVRVEAFGHRLLELLHELLLRHSTSENEVSSDITRYLVSSLHNILCHIFRLFEVLKQSHKLYNMDDVDIALEQHLHNDVVVTVRGSGNGFLMSILPMNHTVIRDLNEE